MCKHHTALTASLFFSVKHILAFWPLKVINYIIFLVLRNEVLEDCPLQPLIPLYLLVGGVVGSLKVLCIVYEKCFTCQDFDITKYVSSELCSDRILKHLH